MSKKRISIRKKVPIRRYDLTRNYKDPQYLKWRRAIRKRDGRRCQMPGCTLKRPKIQVHHILKWSSYPHLRYDINNGITLCVACHKKIRGKEDDYVRLFCAILINRLKNE